MRVFPLLCACVAFGIGVAAQDFGTFAAALTTFIDVLNSDNWPAGADLQRMEETLLDAGTPNTTAPFEWDEYFIQPFPAATAFTFASANDKAAYFALLTSLETAIKTAQTKPGFIASQISAQDVLTTISNIRATLPGDDLVIDVAETPASPPVTPPGHANIHTAQEVQNIPVESWDYDDQGDASSFTDSALFFEGEARKSSKSGSFIEEQRHHHHHHHRHQRMHHKLRALDASDSVVDEVRFPAPAVQLTSLPLSAVDVVYSLLKKKCTFDGIPLRYPIQPFSPPDAQSRLASIPQRLGFCEEFFNCQDQVRALITLLNEIDTSRQNLKANPPVYKKSAKMIGVAAGFVGQLTAPTWFVAASGWDSILPMLVDNAATNQGVLTYHNPAWTVCNGLTAASYQQTAEGWYITTTVVAMTGGGPLNVGDPMAIKVNNQHLLSTRFLVAQVNPLVLFIPQRTALVKRVWDLLPPNAANPPTTIQCQLNRVIQETIVAEPLENVFDFKGGSDADNYVAENAVRFWNNPDGQQILDIYYANGVYGPSLNVNQPGYQRYALDVLRPFALVHEVDAKDNHHLSLKSARKDVIKKGNRQVGTCAGTKLVSSWNALFGQIPGCMSEIWNRNTGVFVDNHHLSKIPYFQMETDFSPFSQEYIRGDVVPSCNTCWFAIQPFLHSPGAFITGQGLGGDAKGND